MHTKGPWKALPTHDAGTTPYIESSRRTIAVMVPVFNRHQELHATTEDFDNASLIAAAPELLEMCKWIFDALGDELDFLPYNKLNNVILKAKGVTPN